MRKGKHYLNLLRVVTALLLTAMIILGTGVALAEKWTCPSCGKTGIESKFCPDCGDPFEENDIKK